MCVFHLISISSLKFDFCPLNCDPTCWIKQSRGRVIHSQNEHTHKSSPSFHNSTSDECAVHIKREDMREIEDKLNRNCVLCLFHSFNLLYILFILSGKYVKSKQLMISYCILFKSIFNNPCFITHVYYNSLINFV